MENPESADECPFCGATLITWVEEKHGWGGGLVRKIEHRKCPNGHPVAWGSRS